MPKIRIDLDFFTISSNAIWRLQLVIYDLIECQMINGSLRDRANLSENPPSNWHFFALKLEINFALENEIKFGELTHSYPQTRKTTTNPLSGFLSCPHFYG